ncbi:MAG: hypothetical protein Q8S73_44935 [Deltaproteobacteria bacterium]|nr:hypothetical protein [Deltaproteobacteria bacterium]
MLVTASTATAQTDGDALRRDLLAQADQAREAGDHARAVQFAERAAALRMSPSLALLLAQEHEQLGHLVTALDHARRCTADATSDTALRNRDRLLGICRELAGVLTGRVGHITVRVPTELARATVRVGDRELPSAAWGVAVSVDPGEVVVRVSDETRHHVQTLTVRVVAGTNVEVEVPAPEVTAPLTPEPRRVLAQPERTAARVVTPPEGPPRRGAGAGPWVVVGFGAAAFASAGVLWALHDGAMSERDGACDVGGCDPSAIDADARMRTLTTATNVAIGLGSAAGAGAAVWWLVSGLGGRETQARPTVWVVPTEAGVTVGGVF